MARTPYDPVEWERARRLGEVLLNQRRDRGLSRNRLAREAGASPENIRKIEEGRSPGVGFLLISRVASALGLRLGDLDSRIAGRNERDDTHD